MPEYVPDNLDLFNAHEAQQQRALKRYPKCDYCGKTITDDRLFDIEGDIFHEECTEKQFKKWTEDYVE